MKNFTNGAMAGSVWLRLKEIKRQRRVIKNSALSEEEKAAALKLHNCIYGTSLAVIMIGGIITFVMMGIGVSKNAEGLPFILSSIGVLLLICITDYIVKNHRLKPWMKLVALVDNGFDKLPEADRKALEPNEAEEKVIQHYKKKYALINILFAFILVLFIAVVSIFQINTRHFIPLAILIVFAGSFGMLMYIYDEKLKKARYGYYKSGLKVQCKKCSRQISIPFDETDQYLSSDENGLRTVFCPDCGTQIKLFTYESEMKDYHEYMGLLKGYEEA